MNLQGLLQLLLYVWKKVHVKILTETILYMCYDCSLLLVGVVIMSYSVGTTSVQLIWEPLPDNTVVSGTCCLDKTIPSSCETSSSTLNSGSVTISDLEEFTEYVCYINDRSRDVPVITSSASEFKTIPIDVDALYVVECCCFLRTFWSSG